MRTFFKTYLMICLGIFLIGTVTFSQENNPKSRITESKKFSRKRFNQNDRRADMHLFLYDTRHLSAVLKLDSSQIEELNKINEPYFEYVKNTLPKISEVREKLTLFRGTPSISIKQIKTTLEKQYDLKIEMDLKSIELERDIYNILNNEQKKRFLDILQNFTL